MKLKDLSIFGLTTGCILLGFIWGAVYDGGHLTNEPIYEYIKDWQTLIGFMGTIGVGLVAWVNVSRQLGLQRETARLTLVAREEDRIDRAMPGIRDASFLLSMLISSCNKNMDDVAKMKKSMKQWGFEAHGQAESAKEVIAALPLADIPTQAVVRANVRRILAAIELLNRAKTKPDIDKQKLVLGQILNDASEVQKQFDGAIDKKGELAIRLRAQIEGFFGG